MAGIPNPYTPTNAAGQFYVESDGYVQGMAIADPVARFDLATGIFDTNATGVLWGGVGITENIPAAGRGSALGSVIDIATTISTTGATGALTGFVVSDQAYNWITNPQNTAPSAKPGMSVPYYRFGSGARIAVQCDPALVDLDGAPINQQVSWDFVNQRLVPYLGTLTISSGTYVSGTGVVTLTMSAPITFSPGDAIVVSGLTGTGAYAALDGTFTALAGTIGSTVVYNAGAGHGAATITGGSLTLGSGASSALPVRVLQVQASGNKTVVYDPVAGTVNYQNAGAIAVILLN